MGYFKEHQIIEEVNDFHPVQKMGRRKSSCSIDDKTPAKTARAATKLKPLSLNASYGRAGHSSWWD